MRETTNANGEDGAMILTTNDELPGRRVERSLGLVRGNTIRARHLGRDVMAVLRNLVGGEIKDYTKMLAESREQSIDRMVEEAEALGADAVLEVRFETSQVMGAAAELLCYGTAVVTEETGEEEGGPAPSG